MKKTLTLLLCTCLLCTSLAGCDNSKTDPIGDAITHYTTEGKVTKLVGDETATGELSVNFMAMFFPEYSDFAQKMYNELYPNVKLDFKNEMGTGLDFFQKFDALQTEIMAGKGPDVFPVVGEALDPYKTMKAGAYLDMAPYFEADKNFNADDFNTAVLYGGQMQGKQYVVPATYFFPLYMTTSEIIEETGLNLSKCKDYISTGNELVRVLKAKQAKQPDEAVCYGLRSPYYLLSFANIPWIDHTAERSELDTPQMKEAYTQLADSIFPFLEETDGSASPNDVHQYKAVELAKQQIVFEEITSSQYSMTAFRACALAGLEKEAVLFPWRDVNGEITATTAQSFAVSSSTKNAQNAYNFIKMLICPEFNKRFIESIGGIGGALNSYDLSDIPLSKVAVKENLEFISEATKDGISHANGYGGVFRLKSFSDDFIDQYMSLIDEVTGMDFEPNIIYEVQDIMQPFLEGTKSYEECMKDAQNKVEIYVSE